MLIYKIQIPKETDAEAFVTFMREEYIPAVHKGPSRNGQVFDLVLLQGNNTDFNTDQFFWHVDGVLSYPRVDVEAESKFKSFGARLEDFGDYREVTSWHASDNWTDDNRKGMVIYKIQLPKETDEEDFVTFVREEYILAVDKGPTRGGQVTDLVLLQGNNTDFNTDQFFWHINGSSFLRVDEEVKSKFNSFTAKQEYFGDYREVTAWNA